jgi:hypothetical protein
MKKILMICYGGGHMKVIAPLYEPLSRRYDIEVLALTVAKNYMLENGIPAIGFSSFDFLKTEDILHAGKLLADNIPGSSNVDPIETQVYLGASFNDLVDEIGLEAASDRYKLMGRAAFLPVRTLEKIIRHLNVDLVITTNAPRAEKAALIASRALDVDNLCINDNLWLVSGIDAFKKGLVDHLCVISQGVKDSVMEQTDMQADTIHVTGTPVFDSLKKIKRSRMHSIPRVLLADCDLPVTDPFSPGIVCKNPNYAQEVRFELNKLASKGAIELIFRPHPNQVNDYVNYPYALVSHSHESLHDLLKGIDIVVTDTSTVGLEAKVMGLGLVSLENTVYSTIESYARAGLSTGIEDPVNLEVAIFKEFSELKNPTTKQHELYSGLAVNNISSLVDLILK